MQFEFTGEIWEWRGPSPYHFVSVPEEQCGELEAVSREVTYGWGMIPVSVRLGSSSWTTSLWPKDGGYILPIKDAVRRADDLELGDEVRVSFRVAPRNATRSRTQPGAH